MDDLSLALELAGKTKTTEERSELVNPSSASIVYMIAVTSSSGGQVVLKNETESESEWEDGDFVEIDEDGDFEEYESEDDPLEDVDDGIVDMTDGDGVDIEETDTESVSFSVADYQASAQATYADESAEEADPEEDELAAEDESITDPLDDGDATELPDDGETSEEDELPDKNAEITDSTDDEYTLIDDASDDESEDYVAGAETSDGYTVASCIGSIKEGDRVAVMVQDGKITVLGVVGSGDEQDAFNKQQELAIAEANELSEKANSQAEEAIKQSGEATDKADTAINSAKDATTKAENAIKTAGEATAKLEPIEQDFNEIKGEEETFKAGLEKVVDKTASAKFATKTDLISVQSNLDSAIQQTAARISMTVSEEMIQDLSADAENSVAEARKIYNNALTQYQDAQKTYELALSEKTNADSILSNALASLNELKSTVSELKASEGATDEQIAEAESIQAKAQASYDNAVTTVNTVNNVLKDCISDLNASKTILDLAQDKLNECIDANIMTKAEFKVESDKISSSVKKEIEKIEVGGRNLLTGTGNGTGWECSSFDSETRTFSRNTIETTESYIQKSGVKLENGVEYTLSCYAKQNGYVQSMEMFFYDAAITRPQCSESMNISTEWKKYFWTFTPEEGYDYSDSYIRFDNNGSTAEGTEAILYVRDIKLEKGNKATDWTPAQEDVDERISSAQNASDNAIVDIEEMQSTLQQLADSIASLVRSGSSGSLVRQDEDGLYYFDVSGLEESLSNASEKVNDLEGVVLDDSGKIDVLQTTAKSLQERTEYVRSYTKDDKPCLDLGEGDSDFMSRITNKGFYMMYGDSEEDAACKIENTENGAQMTINKAEIAEELQHGVFVWKKHGKGNFGLTRKAGV